MPFFVEKSLPVFSILQKNINAFPYSQEQAVAIRKAAIKWLPHFTPTRPCLFFIDPPYHTTEYQTTLALISEHTAIPQQSLMVVESLQGIDYPLADRLERIKIKKYGISKLDFLVKF